MGIMCLRFVYRRKNPQNFCGFMRGGFGGGYAGLLI